MRKRSKSVLKSKTIQKLEDLNQKVINKTLQPWVPTKKQAKEIDKITKEILQGFRAIKAEN